MDILEKMIDIKKSEGASDTPIWEWLHRLIKTLGDEGTSSDESEVDEQTGQRQLVDHKWTHLHSSQNPHRREQEFTSYPAERVTG